MKKKICLLGYYAVGKTSLIRRFVNQIFSEKYSTTIGVKIDKKVVTVSGKEVDLLIWDIHGEDKFQKVQQSYLTGASGILHVVDTTRTESFETYLKLNELVNNTLGNVPSLILLNKTDLTEEREVFVDDISKTGVDSGKIIETSAKTGKNVNEAFIQLTLNMIEANIS